MESRFSLTPCRQAGWPNLCVRGWVVWSPPEAAWVGVITRGDHTLTKQCCRRQPPGGIIIHKMEILRLIFMCFDE